MRYLTGLLASMSISLLFFLVACNSSGQSEHIDALLINAKVYTVDSNFTVAEAVAINQGKIVGVGTANDLINKYSADSVYDMDSAIIYPGFIDAHCHFFYYGKTSVELNLKGVRSLAELERRTKEYGEKSNDTWIIGRGWNETLWTDSQLVHNRGLNEMFPNRPVVLSRVDGHSVLANAAALEAGGYLVDDSIQGGQIVSVDGVMTGVLVDKAADKLKAMYPELSKRQMTEALLKAQSDCFELGLTTVADAGLALPILKHIKDLTGKDLQMRIYAMANPGDEEFQYLADHGKVDLPSFKVRSVKLYGDGSLGSKSAWLKKAYCGEKGNHGLAQHDTIYFKKICQKAKDLGLQLNTHCIGDSANAVLLNLYADIIGTESDHRWRIEHAQIVDTADMYLFGKYGIIPSVQPTHAMSDMHMAVDRLCNDLTGAYAYKSLLNHAGLLAFGTDFPVEDIDPLATYYAAVERRNADGELFESQEALSRENALKAMTIWAAYACFMENEVGSIELGKNADFTILDTDLIEANDVQNARVLHTFVGGKQVYLATPKK